MTEEYNRDRRDLELTQEELLKGPIILFNFFGGFLHFLFSLFFTRYTSSYKVNRLPFFIFITRIASVKMIGRGVWPIGREYHGCWEEHNMDIGIEAISSEP